MSIRIATLGVPRFRLHDLDLNEQWLAIDELTEKQRAYLVTYAGTYVRIHPDDVDKIGSLGLAMRDGKVTDAKKSNPKTEGGKPDASGKAGAKKEI